MATNRRRKQSSPINYSILIGIGLLAIGFLLLGTSLSVIDLSALQSE